MRARNRNYKSYFFFLKHHLKIFCARGCDHIVVVVLHTMLQSSGADMIAAYQFRIIFEPGPNSTLQSLFLYPDQLYHTAVNIEITELILPLVNITIVIINPVGVFHMGT